jgi:hypothetical protein
MALGFISSTMIYANIARGGAAWGKTALTGSPGVVGLRWIGGGGRLDPLRFAKGLMKRGVINPAQGGRLDTIITRGIGAYAEKFPSTWARASALVTGAGTSGGVKFGAFTAEGAIGAEVSPLIRQQLQGMKAGELWRMTKSEAESMLANIRRPAASRLGGLIGGPGFTPRKQFIAQNTTRLLRASKIAGAAKVLGGVLTPLNWVLWGALAGTLAHEVGKGVGAVAGYAQVSAQRVVGKVRSMEFGEGYLAAGFETRMAMTERQRAIQEIGRHSLNARRTLGSEARNMQTIY